MLKAVLLSVLLTAAQAHVLSGLPRPHPSTKPGQEASRRQAYTRSAAAMAGKIAAPRPSPNKSNRKQPFSVDKKSY